MNDTPAGTAPPAADARQRAELLARFFRGLDEPLRVLLLELLLDGEKSVTELVALTGSPQGRVSTHLGCLRWCGYVAARRDGRKVYYRLADARVRALLRLAQELMADHAQQLLACAVVSPDVPGATVHAAEGLEDAPPAAPARGAGRAGPGAEETALG
ncbi:MAG TPA: helix-turn-helix domain-containing protein [Chloroflexota bacterium]|nr:helix-turn-helix domain-containing protein [Chloroflexota bacterium]